MKLTKQLQYGLLFVFYLSKSGRSTNKYVSYNLGIPLACLEQITRKLRLSGIISSVKGPGGGYELVGDPFIGDIVDALSPFSSLKSREFDKYSVGLPETRALVSVARSINSSMSLILNRKIRNVVNELVANEIAQLEKITMNSRIN